MKFKVKMTDEEFYRFVPYRITMIYSKNIYFRFERNGKMIYVERLPDGEVIFEIKKELYK